MIYGSVCSGIEAATMAWHPIGWKPAFFSEIDDFPSAVLKHHYPDVPLHGDFTTIKRGDYEPIDLLVGGTPCQSFSIAGLRGGLGDDRGNLALEYLRLAQRLRPKWLVWENVPGVLSSNGGRDFGSILGGMVELGYGVAYRILDAQYVRTLQFPWAVPQRRRRVFVVGYLGDWRRAAAVLFDRESLSGNPPPRREAGKGASADVAPSLVSSGRGVERIGETRGQDPVVAVANSGDVSYCLAASAQQSLDAETETLIASATGDVSHALRAEGFDASDDRTGRGTPIVAFDCKGSQVQFTDDGSHPTLRSMAHNASHQNAGGHAAVALPEPLHRVFMKGVTSLTEKEYTNADATQARPGEALRALRRSYGAKAFQEWCVGVDSALQSTEVLRSDMHGAGIRRATIENAGMVNDPLPLPKGSAERAMPEMRGAERAGRSPHRPRSHEQRSGQSDAYMPKLPQQGASAEEILRDLRRSDEGSRLLQQASDTLEKVWRSDGDEDSATEEMHRLRCSSALEVALREALYAGQAGRNATSLTDRSGAASEKGGFGVYAVRRLTPRLRECERLQGFPDGFTDVPWRGKDHAPDGRRYKALGNSMAVNVMRYIGDRIKMVEDLAKEME